MFEIGRWVSYRSEGVCRISDIREEAFGGQKNRYYVLSPMQDVKSTVYVPVDNERLVSQMQPLLSAREICCLVDSLREVRMEWIAESRLRNNRFREILANGQREELIVMLLTLMDREQEKGKRNSIVDENAAKRAKRLLLEEFSFTTDMTTEEELSALLRGEWICRDQDVS
ncbi:MAG: hypothetical protein IJY42_01495 [Clostridia bacterium]|nr:hypothetical protein [Clostridia bacterium]